MAAKHAAWKRKAEDEQLGYVEFGPLPMTPPDWFRADTGEPVEHVAYDPAAVAAGIGSENFDWLGRPVAPAPEPSPEDIFKAAR